MECTSPLQHVIRSLTAERNLETERTVPEKELGREVSGPNGKDFDVIEHGCQRSGTRETQPAPQSTPFAARARLSGL